MTAPLWLVGLLAIHERATGVRDLAAHCRCGWSSEKVGSRATHGTRHLQLHREHVAEAIAEALARIDGAA